VALHYLTTYSEAFTLLDPAVYGPTLDIALFTRLCEDAEARFDNHIRRYYHVPIDSSTSPEAFGLAKKVVAYWSAAAFARAVNQAEGDERDNWHARVLDDAAKVFMGQLEAHHVPDDVEEAADARVWLPGYSADYVQPAAIFTRAKIASGEDTHW
jgi:hypothetical protein